MKALGTGWAQGIGFLQVEVYRRSSGAPSLRLHGEAQRRAEALGVEQLWLSISHDGPTAVARLRQGAVRLPRYGEVLAVGVGAPDGRPGRVGIDIPQASKAVRASSLNCIPALPAGRSVGKSVGSLDMSVGMSVGIPLGTPLGRPPDPCGGALGRWLRSTPAASRHVRIAARSGPPLPPFGPTDGPPFGPLLEPSDGATDCSPVADGEDPTGPSEPHADSPRAAHRVTTANAGRFLRRVDLVMGAAFLSGMIVIWR